MLSSQTRSDYSPSMRFHRLLLNRLPALIVLMLAVLMMLSACASTPDTTSADTSALAADQATVLAGANGQIVAATPVAAGSNSTPVAVASSDTPQDAPDDSETPPTSSSATQPTQAELDYAAIYGGEVYYDPIADPTLPEPATLPTSYDPWEPFNRRMHRVNQVIDTHIAKPLAEAYMAVVPRPVRLGIGNFFRNLGQPVAALNSLLQGKPKQAGQALARFTLNATLGIGGIFDPASDAGLPLKSEDFGQTLGVWGWESSRYVELPLFGPRTVRDVVGLFGDAPLSPLRGVEQDKTRVVLQGLQLLDVRTQLMSVDSMLEGAPDEYALLRDAWLQRRNYQIQRGHREGEEELPDYLDEEYNPTVPVDAMPIMPPDGG